MSDNDSADGRRRTRFSDRVRTDADEVQDWINSSTGSMALAGIVIFVGVWALVQWVF